MDSLGPDGASVGQCGSKTERKVKLTDQDAEMQAPNSKNQRKKENSRGITVQMCGIMARRPKTVLGVFTLFHLLFIIATASLVSTGYDLFPLDISNIPLNLVDDDTFLRIQAWKNRDTDATILPKYTSMDERSEVADTLELFLESDNMFTAENLRKMKSLEDELTQATDYQKYCQIDDRTGMCLKPWSILRYFDGSLGPYFNDPDYSQIPRTLISAMSSSRLAEEMQYLLAKDSVINGSHAISSVTRSIIMFGMPLTGYKDSKNQTEEQETVIKNFIVQAYRDKLFNYYTNGFEGIGFLSFSKSLFEYDVQEEIKVSFMLAIGSFLFSLIFMIVQTRSLLISALGMLGLLTSFVASAMIYRIVFDCKYFGIFHLLSIFIIICVGVDNLFILSDNWRATSYERFDSLKQRYVMCYRRAAGSILASSLTAIFAFISNVFQPFLAITTFGIYLVTMVIVSALTSVTLFAAMVLNYHLSWESWTWPCFKPCSNNAEVSPSRKSSVHTRPAVKKQLIIRFFCAPFFGFVTHKIARWIIVVVSLALVVVFSYYASQLKPSTETTDIFEPTHAYSKASNRRLHGFKPSTRDQVIRVYLVWGLKYPDRSTCHRTKQDCAGRTVWDNGFDLNPKPAQVYLKELCNAILNMNDTMRDKLKVRKNSITQITDMECFLTKMETYLQSEETKAVYNGTASFDIPLTESKVRRLMEANPEHYNTSAISTTHYRYFESGVSFWLYDGYSGTQTDDFEDFYEYVGFSTDKYDTLPVNNTGYFYGTRLQYAAIAIDTDLFIGNVDYETGLPVMDAWEGFLKAELNKLPSSLSGGFQCTPERDSPWHWFKVQKILLSSTRERIGIAICLVFILVTIVTRDIILGFLATLTVGCVTVTVIGLIPMVGWNLGALEAMNICFVVGMATRHVVHLAKAYQTSHNEDRKSRVQDMLQMAGVTVLCGTMSTLGVSLFMCVSKVMYFMKFGVIMFSTVGFSLFYSLGLFTALLSIVGPENNNGTPIQILCWFVMLFKRKNVN